MDRSWPSSFSSSQQQQQQQQQQTSPSFESVARQERAAVQDFCEQVQDRWQTQTNDTSLKNKPLSLATFPFTDAERQLLQHATRQGLVEGTLAGIATLAALRGGPWVLNRLVQVFKKNAAVVKGTNFQSPFAEKATPLLKGAFTTSTTIKNHTTTQSTRYRWMDAGFLIIDSALAFAVAMAVSTHYAPAGDPVIESIIGMPGLTERTTSDNNLSPSPSSSSSSSSQPSVVIHQICPLTIDLYQEWTTSTMEGDPRPILAQTKPQTYYLDALQRFVRNCQRRQRVEQTTAWQERNQDY